MRYHKAILALTTAFWDAQLKGDKEAKVWLDGDGAKSVLTPMPLRIGEWTQALASKKPRRSGLRSAHAHEMTMNRARATTHGLAMGFGGSESAAP